MRVVVLILLLSPLAPLAAAECVGPVCASEWSFGPAECAAPGDYGAGGTEVDLAGAARVAGSWYCYNDWETGAGSGHGVSASAAGSSVLWSGAGGGCAVFVYSGEGVTEFPCAAPPPNPGWGRLLP